MLVAEVSIDAEDDTSAAAAAVLVTTKPGPAATALAARAAAAIPLEPSLAAMFSVVPVPMTVNLVQSSAVPRCATGMRTG